MNVATKRAALVVFSGGQDSTTCLYWAKERFDPVHALTFDYGQKHAIETAAAEEIVQKSGILERGGTWERLALPANVLKSSSPLVDRSEKVEEYAGAEVLPGGIEKTFIPGRNILFLTLAANRAAHLGLRDVVTGVCQEDYGGYPDCRSSFVGMMERTLLAGVWDTGRFRIHTPLMYLKKKDTVKLALELSPGCWEALALSHTCYNGVFPPCGKCHACLLRERGFREAGYRDPLLDRARSLGLLEKGAGNANS